MNRSSAVLAATSAAFFTGVAAAHHNMSARYDFNDRVTITGTLSELDWRNPHIELRVTVDGEGGAGPWSVEGPPPGYFRTREINRSHVEAALGKTVTAEVSRARDGSPAGLLRTMTLPSGEVFSACPQNC
jgi:hypothetical protein